MAAINILDSFRLPFTSFKFIIYEAICAWVLIIICSLINVPFSFSETFSATCKAKKLEIKRSKHN